MEVHLLPHLDTDRASVGAYVLITDITKHRQAELALRESEERLAKFMQATAEGIVFHKDGFIVDANPPVCALMGYRLDELVGHLTTEFIAPDHLAKVAAVIASHGGSKRDPPWRRAHSVEFIARDDAQRRCAVDDRATSAIAMRRARIHHMAHHDALTGLPTCRSWTISSIHPGRGSKGRGSRSFIDLDR
jgi:PAS domain S-box-containing protein